MNASNIYISTDNGKTWQNFPHTAIDIPQFKMPEKLIKKFESAKKWQWSSRIVSVKTNNLVKRLAARCIIRSSFTS